MRLIKHIQKTTIPKLNKPVQALPRKRRIQKHGKEPVLVCSKCKTVFPEFLARCPECGSRDWQGLSEVNPYNNAPLEQFLKLCGHLMWLGGCIACIFLLWQTTSSDQAYNELLVLSAVLVAAFGVFASVGYFGSVKLTAAWKEYKNVCVPYRKISILTKKSHALNNKCSLLYLAANKRHTLFSF